MRKDKTRLQKVDSYRTGGTRHTGVLHGSLLYTTLSLLLFTFETFNNKKLNTIFKLLPFQCLFFLIT